MNLELFYKHSCPYCQKVLRVIDKYHMDSVKKIDIASDMENMERLKNIGGKNQVPCLFIDGKPMYESADIIKFLKEQFVNEDQE